MEQLIPKKHLGQHFLKDENIARKIVDSLGSKSLDILEIGPGQGILTRHLINKKNTNLRIVEVDHDSVELLSRNFPLPEKNIIEADFLKLNLDEVFNDSFAVIGNFPYNISSQILFKILKYRDKVQEVVCMLQKEVADRIASPPGNKKYGILSVLLQAYYDINLLFNVSEKVFYPKPNVQSAVIKMNRNAILTLECDEELFVKVVKTAFNQRRKTMRNSLRTLVADKLLLSDVIFSKRPEQLSVQEFVNITNIIDSTRGG